MKNEKFPLFDAHRHAITQDRPRLLGSAQHLKELARLRPEPYQRMVEYARRPFSDQFFDINAKMLGLSIACVVEGERKGGRQAVDLALSQYIDQPLQVGHVTFAHSMARCAVVYDLCHDLWTADERKRFQTYVHQTIAANVESEPSVFHNGWWGYKNWGYGMSGYALMHDDPEAEKIIRDQERIYLTLGAPGLRTAGQGGGWAEGYYIHYWLFEWLFFCEVARVCEGLDYYAAAPSFFGQRAVAAMFENYPPMITPFPAPAIGVLPAVKATEISRRLVPMGDGHGKYPKHERDKTLSTRRILVNYHRDDPAHQAVHAFNLQTPRVAVPADAYMDFLWNDTTVKAGNLDAFKLSHVSPGSGFTYARSSWKDDATYFFFRSGPRFTSHQHLDNGTFHIFKNEELIGDGGHYDTFGGSHAVNYYCRTIAHNSILIHDPNETWPRTTATTKGIRSGPSEGNDGGQAFPWIVPGLGHNGGAPNLEAWERNRNLLDIGHLTAYADKGHYLYTAGDYTRSYSAAKAKCVTRQIVYLRPNTFVIFDRVESTNAAFRKTLLLQTMKVPVQRGSHWVVTHGKGRLWIQCLSPADPAVRLHHGANLYEYGGHAYPPTHEIDAAAECRMEISPAQPATFDYFLQVLTASNSDAHSVPLATSSHQGHEVVVKLEDVTIRFALDRAAGSIQRGEKIDQLVDGGAERCF